MASRASTSGILRWSQNKGRNGWDIATEVREDMTCESFNVDLERGALGKKRRGSATQTITGTYSGHNAIFRFIPAQDDTAAEVFIVDTSATTKIGRVVAGTAFSNLTLKDNVASNPHLVRAAQLNGKLYLAYDTTVNRLNVYDPGTSTTAVRRSGLATPAAPTAADTGAGGPAATLRYYRVQWKVISGSTVQRQSLLGPSVSRTNTAASQTRVTQPTVPSEGETHWMVYGSTDDVLYYEVSGNIAIATTTYDDAANPANYDANDPAPDDGAFTPFPSVKYILSTGERLMGLGVWESSAGDSLTPRAGRVFFTPTLDSSDSDDDERVSNTIDFIGWIDLARNSGSEDRALAGPLDGIVFGFQSRGIYMLAPTGNAKQPFKRITLTSELGAVSQESTFTGEDEVGQACIYFLDPARGPYRYGASGLEWCGYDVQDIWATINLAATTRVAAGVYDAEQRCCHFWLATGSSNTLCEYLKFFVREARSSFGEGVRGGWVRGADGAGTGSTTFRCIAMLPKTIGATMSRDLKPYLGDSSNLRRWNDASSTQDGSTSYQGYITSKAYDMGAMFKLKRIGTSYLQAIVSSAVTITQSLIRNFGLETRTATVVLTGTGGAETRVTEKFEAAQMTDVKQLQIKLGDSAAANTAWTLDELHATIEPLEDA